MFYEDFEVGQTYESRGRTMRETDITQFSGITWDHHPLHTNEAYAAEAGYDDIIAHGSLTLPICLALGDESGWFEDSTLAFLGIDDLRFFNPVYPGDTIKCEVEITDTRETSDGDRGVITQRRTGLNYDGDQLLEFHCNHLVERED